MQTVRNRLAGIVALVLLSLSFSSAALSQWRVRTPRDTVTVPANKKVMTASKMTLTAGVEIQLWAAGVYKELNGQALFDAGYALQYPGWNTSPPIRTTPPYYYNSQKFEYGLKYSNTAGLSETYFVPSDPAYVATHLYTLKVPSIGNALQFYIKSPDDTYYPKAQDGLLVRMARWTAGICVKNTDISFGNILIGTSKTYLDSIASYGIDPLRVDSIEIIGADKAAFSFISQRVVPFTLANELPNEIKIIFSPQKQGTATARLHIISKNTDEPSKNIYIDLTGVGEEPKLLVLNHEIDFGKVRIGYPAKRNSNFFNGGNATLILQQLNFTTAPAPDIVFSSPMSLPNNTTPGSAGQIPITASPKQRIKYDGMCYVFGNNNLKDSVKLSCEGAAPVPILNPDSVIDFGTVYSGDIVSKPLTHTNKGNWPVSCIKVAIEGASKAAFGFTPPDSVFIVEPDSIRLFNVFFKPETRSKIGLRAYMVFYYDDFGRDSVLLTGNENPPNIIVNPKIHDFGTLRIGAQRTDTIAFLSNSGNIPLGFERQEVKPDFPFSITNIPTVKPLSTVPFFGTFKPIVPGPATAWVYITSGNRDSILLRGTGAVAKAIFDPSPLDFGIVASNAVSQKNVTLTDSGNWPLKIMWYHISGPDSAEFKVLDLKDPAGAIIPALPYAVIEGSKISFDVEFKTNAKTGAVHRARLCLHYDDSTSDCLDLQAIEEKQFIQFATPGLDFGKVRVKNRKQKPARFRNGSNLTLSVGDISITGSTNAFTILDTLSPILPQRTLNINIDFYPDVRGIYTGFFKADSADFQTDSIELHGIGAAPLPVASQSVIDFGIVALGGSKPEPFYIANQIDTNNTDWPMHVVRIWLRGDKYNEFSWRKDAGSLRNTGDTLDIGATSSYTAYFQPNTVIIYHSADLVFTLDDSSELVVKLVGLDESPNLVLGEDTLLFGKIRLGQPPGARSAHLVNTWTDTLTSNDVHIEQAGNEFNPKTFGKVVVPPNLTSKILPLPITFTPVARGTVSAKLISKGGDAVTDTTILIGEGAQPVAKFTPDTVLDFGPVLFSTNVIKSFDLKNVGNWIFSTVDVAITGTNANDFTTNITKITNIEEDSLRNFTVTFLATTPIQIPDRTATIVFTLDDNSKVTYELLAKDRAPLKTDLKLDDAAARIGDIVYPNLRLMTAIPDTLRVNHLKGDVAYDPMIVDLIGVSLGRALQANGWAFVFDNSIPGKLSYELSHPTDYLSKPAALIQLSFKPHLGVAPGAQSPLAHIDFAYPDTKEVQAALKDGIIIIDSTCGNTHLVTGPPTASFIRQNNPNPFGSSTGSALTSLSFNVGSDEANVMIRILDASGREVMRLLDNASYKRGIYEVKVDASKLSSGTYFYEFRANNEKLQIRKMVVGK